MAAFFFYGRDMRILGILNITTDSFSDGGKFLAVDAALAQARTLAQDGAHTIDIGAASSNPNSQPVDAATEIARLAAIVPTLKAQGLSLSIDTFATDVQRWAMAQGVDYLNDIHGFADDRLYPELAASSAKLIVMHMVQDRGVAVPMDVPPAQIYDRVCAFFDARLAALDMGGIGRDRLILDPGMGQFVGADPQNSLILLRRIPDLKKRYGLPVLISVSRKGFLRKLTGRGLDDIGPATLTAELFAQAQGADLVRTHAPGPLRDGVKILKSLENSR